ncbi:MAG: hypothetical protein ACOVT5_02945, partial [Armatimonadaceae bacterium]
VTLTPGAQVITYWSVDNAGNVETAKQLMIGLALQNVTLDKVSAVGGNNRTLRVKLTAAAPAGGVRVDLLSDNPAASVPAFVDIAAAADSANVAVATTPVSTSTSVVISATLGDQSKSAQLELLPPSARLTATPKSVVGGANVTLTANLDGPAPAGGLRVDLVSDTPSVLPVPASITVPEGQVSAAITVASIPTPERAAVLVTASTDTQSAVAPVVVDAPAPASVVVNPAQVNGGTGTAGTVTLNGPAPDGGYEVTLTASAPSATVPASVTVPAGQTSAAFAVTTRGVAQNTTTTITATANNVRKSASLTVRATAISSVQVSPGTVIGSQSAVGRVELTGPAPDGGLVVYLASSSNPVVVPPTVTVPAGETSADFNVQTTTVVSQTVATLTATFNGVSKTANLTVTGLVLQGFTVNPSS